LRGGETGVASPRPRHGQMTSIVLSDEQAQLLQGASPPVVFVDSNGKKLAEIAAPASRTSDGNCPTDDEFLAEALRRREQARREGMQGSTTQEVLARLRALRPE
jgi:hypothetical protein